MQTIRESHEAIVMLHRRWPSSSNQSAMRGNPSKAKTRLPVLTGREPVINLFVITRMGHVVVKVR
jgi:hypothetical protein